MNIKELFHGTIYVVLGNFVLAAGVALFVVPNSILTGGVAGLAVIFAPILHVDTTLLINVLTVVLFILGALTLGKRFAIKTLLSTVLYPSFLLLLTPIATTYQITDDPLLASIYAGVLVGGGVGLVFRTGASTGGMDIPPLIIHKHTNIKLSTLVLITDGLTVLLGMSFYGVEPALIGLISVWISSQLINKTMMLGMLEAKSLMIVSDNNEEILQRITTEINRGATILKGEGGYTRVSKNVLMVVVSRQQFPKANQIINEVDANAFVIVHDVNEVQGEGFTYDI